MPRKASKTEKPALLFLERPVGGARLQNVPEVRAALNPKEFFTETQAHSSSTLNSWVNPQFDTSVAAAAPLRRGRRKCQSATTSILDRCSQLSRKNSVCKFPSLSFQTRSRDQSHQPKSVRTARKAAESTVVSGNQPRGSCQIKKAVSCAQKLDTPRRQSASFRIRKAERSSDVAASSSRCVDRAETPSIGGETLRVRADGASTPASSEFSDIGLAPDVDTPNLIQEGSSCPSSPSVHLLLARSCTPPCNQPPDILVADTPERDYGVKVTWRKRKGLMSMLKERGLLSDSDVLIQS
ncbi:putative RAD9 HUS1 RAD1-interacting nuclear orphan protein 1 [Scophthalmus maximus]|uniref:Putative RAD9 HUS1 RAD1-interacting nuclear orphan protein 1 n=1 Tax=Scophthalmus maximus TaxID=52904 RepID=A0A2U9B2R4_SCOMX|nr:RAD9, HUS1, RAD1-interacting nuclear orphan protein 1 [Scophthalmus maximus]AWO98196.1 putative RAD9 HUS1 RAD1-interacting nuclear orphan protein 1 [Scophthalmus maximus]